MAKNGPEIIICFIVILTIGLLILINKFVNNSEVLKDVAPEYRWIVHGFINILGYLTLLIPGYIVHKYIKKINYLYKAGDNCFVRIISRCFEEEIFKRTSSTTVPTVARTPLQDVLLLLFYFMGLQVSFLSWGVLQEKVMTQQYQNSKDEIGHFKDSQFLVFFNRILAFCLSGFVILFYRQARHKCPMYKYVFCSLSNILSSWCQYEALIYVSFPHQVLSKAAKTIPVMIMGKIISHAKYEYYEYITAIILSLGMLFFMMDTGNNKGSTITTTFSGVILLCCYIAFDSFTSNWQGSLFEQYSMTPVQMMCAVNLFSCTFTVVSLLQQDCILLSVCSAAGQLFIYSTISAFGPLVFAIISTIRQGFSVLLSCLIYKHEVNALGIFGIILVFFSILFRIYCGHKMKTIRQHTESSLVSSVLKH